jgi:signal transduction histidine kinase
VLAAFVTLVYAGLVVGVGAAIGRGGNAVLSAVAAAVVALAFQPVRRRAQRIANRLVYGERATPYEVLSDFSDRMGGAFPIDDLMPRMAQVLARGTGASSARVMLRVGAELRELASWPPGAGAADGEHVTPVSHQGEDLGALAVAMPASDPMDPVKGKLVRDLASQAGLVLRNARLIEELRASRQRIVAVQDEERRRLERDLHDGAQQQLVALTVKARLARSMAERDAAKATDLLEQIEAETQAALEQLRELARGIYPPVLADHGLAAALKAQAARAAVATSVDADGVGRYPREVESAVYFSVLEALNNVAKYAGASRASIRLRATDAELRFEVADDGVGFDPGSTARGTGLQGMADRLDAIGGRLAVRSSPGRGTMVVGRVSVPSGGALP